MAESRVPLPAGVREPFTVYVNGVRQELGRDYRVSEGALVFGRELVKEGIVVTAAMTRGPILASAVLLTAVLVAGILLLVA